MRHPSFNLPMKTLLSAIVSSGNCLIKTKHEGDSFGNHIRNGVRELASYRGKLDFPHMNRDFYISTFKLD